MATTSEAKRTELSLPTGHKNDAIRFNDLILPISLRTGAPWQEGTAEPIEQPISITLSIFHDISSTAQTDKLEHSINYVELMNRVRAGVVSRPFECLHDLSYFIVTSTATFPILSRHLDGLEIHLSVRQLKAPLHTKTISLENYAKYAADGSWTARKVIHSIEDLVCPAIIGVRVDERLERQDVIVNMSIDTADKGLDREDWIDFRSLIGMLYEEIFTSDFLTLEALTSYIASETLSFLKSQVANVSIKIAKPSALALARSSEVEISRTAANYPGLVDDGGCTTPNDVENIAVAAELRQNDVHTVAVALGSNLGDSFRNIEYALRLLETPREILLQTDNSLDVDPFANVIDTSFLYESAPMYVTDQPSFVNCACILETNLSPITLLILVKEIESTVGRVPSIRNGPRAVDLDLIFYDEDVVDTRSGEKECLQGELVVPHPLLQEREFVLRPLNDMIPDYIHPILKKSVKDLLNLVYDPTAPPMNKVVPFPRLPATSSPLEHTPFPSIASIPETLTFWTYLSNSNPTLSLSQPSKPRKTHVMATLNVTPDSFSDGAKHDKFSAAMRYASTSVAAGAAIVDVGGYSTRPGAAFVSVEDEVNRVVPAIKAMRDADLLKTILANDTSYIPPNPSSESYMISEKIITKIMNVPISVDTFRWEVAEAAIQAGANCINDVYAFTGPDSWPLSSPSESEKGRRESEYMDGMKRIARAYSVPVVLMHSRGDAGSNKDYSMYEYAGSGGAATLEGVRVELGSKVERIVKGKGGVRRWFVIVDPGIGFSKSVKGNLEVLKRASDTVADVKIGGIGNDTYVNPLRGYPQLIGPSRKSFLGIILAQESDSGTGRATQPHERVWATAAAVSCAVQQEAFIVRVHDVNEMMDVVKVGEALWG